MKELNVIEIQQVNGGIIPILIGVGKGLIAIGAVVTAGYALYNLGEEAGYDYISN
ncbi:class IIb bacteriocin, lactobin A/cerein 7B family [Thalassotalea crassostreae]|uniref:class IIb bacteriocin, lactobin A/cerein 7B family n=1 Tax=Thalassotalea crassostreae TaxID=1763536 RepID=UPI0009EE0828|nr:class IIb bacteriocin, lactobin A/cerein 7B family [Thalassotalea crassostreae]